MKSKDWLNRHKRDFYVKKAKKQGYLSRAAYKLLEIENKFHFIANSKNEETEFDTINKFEFFGKVENKNNKISAFLTIQEGCDKFCHF